MIEPVCGMLAELMYPNVVNLSRVGLIWPRSGLNTKALAQDLVRTENSANEI